MFTLISGREMEAVPQALLSIHAPGWLVCPVRERYVQGGCAVMLGGWNQHLTSSCARLGSATAQFARPAKEKEGKHSFSGTAPPRGDV